MTRNTNLNKKHKKSFTIKILQHQFQVVVYVLEDNNMCSPKIKIFEKLSLRQEILT
jgi:hypothetical protein